jgi:hypothetical protein
MQVRTDIATFINRFISTIFDFRSHCLWKDIKDAAHVLQQKNVIKHLVKLQYCEAVAINLIYNFLNFPLSLRKHFDTLKSIIRPTN